MRTSGRRGGRRGLYLAILIVLLGAYGYWAAQRPLPLLTPVAGVTKLEVQTAASKLVWPIAGQAAVGIVGSPVLQTQGAQTPTPTASTAKLITALAVLRQKPLAVGEQGPTITLTASDVALYNSYAAGQGSVVQVAAGEQISEYQLLEAMLLPSANNAADSLAVWAFGSLANYTSFANNFLTQLGLSQTRVGSDASGFAPTTVSTAHDLVRIGELVMQQPVLAQIVGQPSAGGIPVVNNVKNVNFLLGTDNIIGIKTGNTDQAGGVFVSASRTTVNGKPVIIITALANSPTLFQALKSSVPLIQSAQTNFAPTSIITSGSIVGRYHMPWGGSIPAIASQSLKLDAWRGNSVPATVHLQSVSSTTKAGQAVGSLVVPKSATTDEQSIPIKLQTMPSKPSIWWRLLHP